VELAFAQDEVTKADFIRQKTQEIKNNMKELKNIAGTSQDVIQRLKQLRMTVEASENGAPYQE
jgi:hypothetical protein